MKRELLFCWELGAGTGHVSPYLPLLKALHARGWDISVAVRDTAEVSDMLRPLGFRLLQAPVCGRQFSGMEANSYNLSEILLHFGYGDVRTLSGLVEAWRSLFRLARPDLVLCSAAPTAQWVAQAEGIPSAMIGSGFNCPPVSQPMPLLRDWVPGVEQRLQNAEATASSVMTSVHAKLFPQTGTQSGVQSFQRLFADAFELLCTFRELDHYPSRGADARYHGVLSARRFPELSASPCEVFAYLRNGTQAETIVDALAQSKLRTLVYWPDASPQTVSRKRAGQVQFATQAVDLATVLGGCRFVVGYASHHLTTEALLAGKPLLLAPNYLEQELTARAVERMGAGISLAGKGRALRLNRVIGQMLDDTTLHETAREFGARYADWSAAAATESLADICQKLVSRNTAFPRKVAAL